MSHPSWKIKKDKLIILDFSDFIQWLDSTEKRYEDFLQEILEKHGNLYLDKAHQWRITDELEWIKFLDSQLIK